MHIHFEHTIPIPIIANIVCPDSLVQVTIPHTANITLRLDCEIQSTSFRIWPLNHLLTKTLDLPTHEISSFHDSSLYGIVLTTTTKLHNITRDIARMRSFLFQDNEDASIAEIGTGVDATKLVESTVASLASLTATEIFHLATTTATSTWSIWVPCLIIFLILATILYLYIQFRLKNMTLLRKLYRRFRGTPDPPSVEMAAVNNHNTLNQSTRQTRTNPSNPPPYAPSAPPAPIVRAGILSKAEFDAYKSDTDRKIGDLQILTKRIPTLITKTAHL